MHAVVTDKEKGKGTKRTTSASIGEKSKKQASASIRD
jgi:hypothetical protein